MKKRVLFGLFMFFTIYVEAQTERVGIGTDDPKTTLDVRGDLIVRDVPKSDNYILLGSNQEHVFAKASTEGGLRPFYNILYQIATTGKGATTMTVNTGIPVEDYDMVLISSFAYPPSESNGNANATWGIHPVKVPDDDQTYKKQLNPLDGTTIFPREVTSGGETTTTWHINVGYPTAEAGVGAWTYKNMRFQVTVFLMAKGIVNILPEESVHVSAVDSEFAAEAIDNPMREN